MEYFYHFSFDDFYFQNLFSYDVSYGSHNVPQPAAVCLPVGSQGVYLFLSLLTIILIRFGDCQPPETASIARLPARWR
jgi:hypothetical protein